MTQEQIEVLEAAKRIKEYCNTIDISCEGCIFRQFRLGKYCLLNNPNHLPETWELEKIKQEENDQ